MKNALRLLAIVATLTACALHAQEPTPAANTNAPKPTLISNTADVNTNTTVVATTGDLDLLDIVSLAEFIKANGHVSVGHGWKMDGSKGVLLNTSVDLVRYTSGRFDGGIALANAIWFGPDGAKDYLGVSMNLAIVKAPETVAKTVKKSSLTVIDAERIYAFGFVGFPIESHFNADYRMDDLLVGAGAGIRF